jgi:hypothetical protein
VPYSARNRPPTTIKPERTSPSKKHVSKALDGTGYADVWKRNFFAWEYKGPHRDLTVAYRQLLEYRDDLENTASIFAS